MLAGTPAIERLSRVRSRIRLLSERQPRAGLLEEARGIYHDIIVSHAMLRSGLEAGIAQLISDRSESGVGWGGLTFREHDGELVILVYHPTLR